MAHQIGSDVEEKKKVERRPDIREYVSTVVKYKVPPLLDSLLALTIVGLYFFFTGLAILFRSPIPKEWLKLSNLLSRGKVAKKVEELAEKKEEVQKKPIRIVDLETKEDISTLPN